VKIIGAGLPRTATTTQMFALERLGFGPCYHMRDLLSDLQGGLPLWERAFEGAPDWERILGGSESTVDWPSARYYRELMDYYPDAKVLHGAALADA
jgi:sulfotransferase family protein